MYDAWPYYFTIRTAHFINNQNQRRILYLALVRSQFEHCTIVWNPSNTSTIDKLESLQKRAKQWILSEEQYIFSPEAYFQKCKLPILLLPHILIYSPKISSYVVIVCGIEFHILLDS